MEVTNIIKWYNDQKTERQRGKEIDRERERERESDNITSVFISV